MRDFFGHYSPITPPHIPEFNRNEISITEIERQALLKGFSIASERLLQDLKTIKRPSKQLQDITERLTIDLQEIRKEYGSI